MKFLILLYSTFIYAQTDVTLKNLNIRDGISTKHLKFLTTNELKKLLINKTRVGKTRYLKDGAYYKSKFNLNGTVDTTVYDKNGNILRKILNGRWYIQKDSICVKWDNTSKISCRKVFKDGETYISILLRDGKFWSKFYVE